MSRLAVVVGAYGIGLEVAEGLPKRGLHVTVIERPDAPMGAVLEADMAADVAGAMPARRLRWSERNGQLVARAVLQMPPSQHATGVER